MKILEKELKNASYILFLDIEGTQHSHEVIEIGAYLVKLKPDYTIDKTFEPISFKRFCVAHEPVGKIVTSMTGITDNAIKENGISFLDTMKELHELISDYDNEMVVATFGSLDAVMLKKSANYFKNNKFLKPYIKFLNDRIWDFTTFINRFVLSEKNQPCSLLKLTEVFNITPYGSAHDALNDAIDLFLIYEKMVSSPEIMAECYLKVLKNNYSIAYSCPIIQKYIKAFLNNELIDFNNFYTDLVRYFE